MAESALCLRWERGFHGDMTGRRKHFFKWRLLYGLSNIDIRRNFDSIVELAEVGKFIDTPVKRDIRGGMYVRLAFAVAAHLL